MRRPETTATLALRARNVETLQMNITRLCNQSCAHCHVEASPARREMMSDDVLEACIEVVERTPQIRVVDITGGAPELHPAFRSLVSRLTALGRRVMVRHNLTVSCDPHPLTGGSMRWVPEFLATHRVELCCSLPCYLKTNTDGQRGAGVFHKSVEALRVLNDLGYAAPGSGLVLDLVHNPVDSGLPGSQAALEADYRRELARHGVMFSRLLAIANVPVGRFASGLAAVGRLDDYRARVRERRDEALGEHVMCRSLISVGADGRLFDCDFHQAAQIPLTGCALDTIFDFDARALSAREIRFAEHCAVCVSGEGSSCSGVLRSAS